MGSPPEPVHEDSRHASLTWKNHAATDAGPTVRNGVAKPSANTILSAFDAFELWVERRRAPGGSIYLEMMMLFIKLHVRTLTNVRVVYRLCVVVSAKHPLVGIT